MKATRRDFGLGGAILAAALAGGCNLVSGLADLTVGDATPPPNKPLAQYVVKQGEEIKFKAGEGQEGTYWIVLDNTGTITGGVKPPGNLFDDRAAVASFTVAIGGKK